MLNGSEFFQRWGADLLGWGIRRSELRILPFQFDQAAKKAIVIRVANQRIVYDVVLVIVFFDLPAELENFFFYLVV